VDGTKLRTRTTSDQLQRFTELNFHGSVHRNNYSNIYPTRCKFTQYILSGNCSTCFGWYLHPSSGAQTTVSPASGISHTNSTHYSVTNTRCCRCSCLRCCGWVEVPPEIFRAVSRQNKLGKVASRWIYIRIKIHRFCI
jgi:hypothetical protein